MTRSTVEIQEIDAFPAKIAAIRDAVTQLRAATAALSQIPVTATQEAASFTTTQKPAPVYGQLITLLQGWVTAMQRSAGVVGNNADAAALTAASKFYAMVQTDREAADAILAMKSSGALPPSGTSPLGGALLTEGGLAGAQEISQLSGVNHPRDETWNFNYTQLLERSAEPTKPSLIVLHSEEGNSTAAGLANSMERDGKSYHYLVDGDGKTIINTVETSLASRGVYDPGNNQAINIGMAGTRSDGWDRDDWLAQDAQLKTTAELAVREAMENNIPPVVVEMGAGTSGIVSHNWVAENIGVPPGGEAHHDVGATTSAFPWDRFTQYVNAAATAAGYTPPQ